MEQADGYLTDDFGAIQIINERGDPNVAERLLKRYVELENENKIAKKLIEEIYKDRSFEKYKWKNLFLIVYAQLFQGNLL